MSSGRKHQGVDVPLVPHPVTPDADGECTLCTLPPTNRIHLTPTEPDDSPIDRPVDEPFLAPSVNHPATSHRAAVKALPRSGTVKAAIFAIIANRPMGATDDELEMIVLRTHQSVSAARNSLMNAGYIEPMVDADGREVTRLTRSRNDAIVWTASTAARARMGGAA